MKIVEVEAVPLWADFAEFYGGPEKIPAHVSVPAAHMKSVRLTGQGAVLVRVRTDDGLVGIGESMGRPGARGIAALIEDAVAPIVLGEDVDAAGRLWRTMSEQVRFAPFALGGVDIALWDIRGKAAGFPIHKLIGGGYPLAHPCYASPIPFLDTPADSADKAEEFVRSGFRAVKLKIGRDVDIDLEHVAEIRGRLGPDIGIHVDANGGYDVARATRLGRGLERLGVAWLEEPVQPEHVDGLAALRRRLDIPIATGEWLGTVYQFHELLKAEAADVLMPNVNRCGGITGMLRIAELAELYDVKVAPHGVGTGVAIVAALHAMSGMANALIYEYNQLVNPLRHAVLDAELQFADGLLHVPSGPGLGIGINQEAVERFDARRASGARQGL